MIMMIGVMKSKVSHCYQVKMKTLMDNNWRKLMLRIGELELLGNNKEYKMAILQHQLVNRSKLISGEGVMLTRVVWVL